MATNLCPACGRPIPAADLNVPEGVGLCRACGKLSRLRDIADQPDVDPNVLAAPPPPGCSVDDRFGGGHTVRASTRSAGTAAGLLFINLFWNGIVSVFVLIAFAGLYSHYVGPLPESFPAPRDSGKNGVGMSVGMAWFLCVFLIPFVTIGLMMFVGLLTCLFGRVEVTVDGTVGRVRTGIGPLNWTRRFDPTKVRRVSQGLSSWKQNDQAQPVVQIDADRTVKFGSMLKEPRRQWMIAVLHAILIAKRPPTVPGRLSS